ncbi:MAG: hypothetical protein COA32_05650 [Fluviicola sp.]|nr:MAG: hypothetical protein COA32_05650 [Fluviicola sp.]
MTDNNKENTKQTYSVSGLSCGGCASTIEIRLSSIPKIKSAKVDMHKK